MYWTIGCIYGASSVALGAFGAHGLKKRIADPSKIANWNTAAHYQVLSRWTSTTYTWVSNRWPIPAYPLWRSTSQCYCCPEE